MLHKVFIVLWFFLSRWGFTVQMKPSLWSGLQCIFKRLLMQLQQLGGENSQMKFYTDITTVTD